MKLLKSIGYSSVFIFLTNWGNAQAVSPEVIASTGDFFTGISANISWTLGEPVIDTYSSTAGTLTQGFQQNENLANEIDENLIQVNVEIFPNPFTSELNIKTQDGIYTIEIRDLTGRSVWKNIGKSSGNLKMNLHHLESGTYFVVLTNENKQQLSKKIIKQ